MGDETVGPRNTKKSKKNNNNDNKEAPEAMVTSSSTPVSTTKSASVSALLSKSTLKSIATTKLTSTSKLKSNSTSTKSTCSTSTLTALTPTASTQFASSLIPTRRFQELFLLDVEANKKKKTNKFEDIIGIKKEISEIHKSIDNSKEKNKKVEESYLNKITQTVSKPFIETDMYLDIEKLKEETKNYLNSNDSEFLAKCLEKKWDHLVEKKIHGKITFYNIDAIETSINERYNGLEGKKEVRKAFEKLHKKINNDNDEETPTWCNKILQKAFPNPDKVGKSLLAFAVGVIEIILDPNNGGIKMLLKLRSMRGNMITKIKSAIFSTFGEDSLPNINNNAIQKDIMDWKEKKEVRKAFEKLHKKINNDNDEETPTWCNKILQKAFPNPDKVGKSLLAFAVGVIEIILDPNNGGIKVKDEIMKSKIRKNIDKIENGNIYISSSSSESSSESEKDNNDNTNEDNEDVGVIYIDSNEENDINLFQMDDKSDTLEIWGFWDKTANIDNNHIFDIFSLDLFYATLLAVKKTMRSGERYECNEYPDPFSDVLAS
ncbi:hypothetical protein Glove_1g49 [Diversispora epigaea]|uniref:Uncharacterized protein n=1 Tax=Diversispora epigaea TaxID=1348612 RepID=A0A397JYB5_9GLOM|nr:hypothetical protein Glove_1g49 [Diversispora epigaea]